MPELIINPSHSYLQLESHRDTSGELQTIGIEDIGDKRIFHYSQVCGHILNDNERLRLDEDTTRRTGEFHHSARIPMAKWLEWERMGITADKTALRKAIECHKEYKVTNKRVI